MTPAGHGNDSVSPSIGNDEQPRHLNEDRPEGPLQSSPFPTCGDFDFRIASDGTWYYQGGRIGRKPLVRLFSTVLRLENGEFWLVTPVERGRIIVDDAPFVAVELRSDEAGADQRLRFRTNVDDWVTVDVDHPIRVVHNAETGEPRPYVHVRGGLEALILRPVFYSLVALGTDHALAGTDRFGVWSSGTFFPLDRPGADE